MKGILLGDVPEIVVRLKNVLARFFFAGHIYGFL